ncbi:MAG: hypothetical protein LBR45_00025 [Bacteroidales bacterium]|nr:hypothetical protein [Bacteroidales bacterium]
MRRHAGWRQEVGMRARWAEIQVRESVEAVEVTDNVSNAGSTRGHGQGTHAHFLRHRSMRRKSKSTQRRDKTG